jgi:hypothetical protein
MHPRTCIALLFAFTPLLACRGGGGEDSDGSPGAQSDAGAGATATGSTGLSDASTMALDATTSNGDSGGTEPTDAAAADAAGDAALPTPATYFQSVFGLTLDSVSWGDMHTHTYYSGDAVLNSLVPGNPNVATPATAHQLARARGFRFSATSDHAEAPVPSQITDGSSNVWESTRKADLADDDETTADGTPIFATFMGYEYTNPYPCEDPTPGDGVDECPAEASDGGECSYQGADESCADYGHKNVIFRSLTGAPTTRVSFLDPASWNQTGPSCNGPSTEHNEYCGFSSYSALGTSNLGLWSWLSANGFAPTSAGAQVVTIVHTPANLHHNDWSDTDTGTSYVHNVEIFSKWGSSEGAPPSNCADQDDEAVSLPTESANADDPENLIRPVLATHWIGAGDLDYVLSFVGGSDDHTGKPGGDGTGGAGVMGLVTSNLTRDGFFDALYARHTLGATFYDGAPEPVLFAMHAGTQDLLGGDLGMATADGTATLYILAASTVQEIQVVVDGCTVATLQGAVQTYRLTGLSPSSRHYVYVRARTSTALPDGGTGTAETAWNQAWSSPVYLTASP